MEIGYRPDGLANGQIEGIVLIAGAVVPGKYLRKHLFLSKRQTI